MGTIRIRFILVALIVGFFAIGMSAFLNFFKYKSTYGNIVRERVLVVGRGIENAVQASLNVGLQFSELGTLQQLMVREMRADKLIVGMDIFDPAGQVIYSTDPERVKREVSNGWMQAAARSKRRITKTSASGVTTNSTANAASAAMKISRPTPCAATSR